MFYIDVLKTNGISFANQYHANCNFYTIDVFVIFKKKYAHCTSKIVAFLSNIGDEYFRFEQILIGH